ncbi:hypothetical protein CGMCC3_g6196 [Colletotrichum fructicola]|uniref:Rhodopsin domain-containing protein n=1 Tax=Colletotrichum fructicola (strain Nara gc5) TaxID=1213859 RepID=L2FCJ3_COLFN|nr:uncharacterized protein CGMCC3_g6196 [Colletotrichum fructicola]KAE9577737.1 hypothetical protein CGMCC3_g6196 [Colletotrichum fructicola]KAF4419579.1 hypothetical protein CFRS1_v005630 [Colletotrichum fructicola]KAF4475316.1 hypothetical protein CGGC5_v015886 [Colletotrichum fructicola Nara gc5]KAF4894876.1 hypothetical protein CGCFRS4_v006190 [Colletotrichum fructicola]
MEINPSIAEIWSLYAIATTMIALRVFCRTKMVGVSGFRPDDYLVLFAWAVYTTVSTMATMFVLVAQGKHTSLLTPEQREMMPESEFYLWEYGSKNFVVGMCCYATIVWTLKFNMLFFYRRLVEGQWVEKFIFPVMGLVGATAIAMVLIIFLTCRPITLMWQIRPDPGENCVPQNKVYFYSILAFNLTTDMCIILIPIPVISLVRASIWRRLGVYFLFSLGVFVMTAAIIRVILIFHPTGQFGPGAMWSIREDFVAIFVGQAPMVVPIFKKRFWQQTRIRWTPKSSQGSEGNELSSGMSNQKKPDPYSLTQMGFTHITNITNITNVTRGTRTEVTVVGKDSQERLAVGAEQVAGEGSTSHGDRSDVEAGNSRSSNMDMASRSLEIARGPDPATWRRDTITSIIEISNIYRDL